MIPKIIHHIAPKNKNTWHFFWNECYESWKNKFSNYQFMLWDDKDDIDNLIKTHYSEYLNLYNAFPFHIMRIDFARLCILHKYGGIYADMDVFCFKNFEHVLNKETYFLENLMAEYTNSCVENSLMASVPNNKLIEKIIKLIKSYFIYHRNYFQNTKSLHWKNQHNCDLVNNTTGSGLLSDSFCRYEKHFDIGIFECRLFNNRPSSYDEKFYTKHVHTSIWGNEYNENKFPFLLLIDGCMYNVPTINDGILEKLKQYHEEVLIMPNENFNFYKDYTNGVYLKENNLEEINKIVSKKH